MSNFVFFLGLRPNAEMGRWGGGGGKGGNPDPFRVATPCKLLMEEVSISAEQQTSIDIPKKKFVDISEN